MTISLGERVGGLGEQGRVQPEVRVDARRRPGAGARASAASTTCSGPFVARSPRRRRAAGPSRRRRPWRRRRRRSGAGAARGRAARRRGWSGWRPRRGRRRSARRRTAAGRRRPPPPARRCRRLRSRQSDAAAAAARGRAAAALHMTMILIWNENHCQMCDYGRLPVLVVNRFRVPEDEAEAFRGDLEAALAVLAQQQGYADGRLGRNVDDPTLWVMVTRWRDVGSYRRALSSYDVKVGAVPLLSRAIDEPRRTSRLDGELERVDAPGTGLSARGLGRVALRPPQPAAGPRTTAGAPPWPSRPPPPSTSVVSLAKRRGSSTRAARSTAAPARPGTTARSASSSRRTSSASGGARWCSRATTSSASTPA